MFQVNIFSFLLWVLICCATCNRKYWLWWSTWLPDEEMVKKLQRKAEMTLLHSWSYYYSPNSSTHEVWLCHTIQLVVQEDAILLLWSLIMSPCVCVLQDLVVSYCLTLHCPEKVDPNHKPAKAVSLMHEHGESCLWKATEHFTSTQRILGDLYSMSKLWSAWSVFIQKPWKLCPDAASCLVCYAEEWLHSRRLGPVFE